MKYWSSRIILLGLLMGPLVSLRAMAQRDGEFMRLLQQAQTAYDGNDYQAAKAYCTQAIERDPRSDVAYAIRADAEQMLKQFAEAIADSDRAIQLNPSNSLAYTIRGRSRRLREELPLALADFDRAIQLDRRNDFYYALRGEVHRQLGQYELAIQDFDETLRLSPGDPFATEQRRRAQQKDSTGSVNPVPSTVIPPSSSAPTITWISPNPIRFQQGYRLTDESLHVEVTIGAFADKATIERTTRLYIDGVTGQKLGEAQFFQKQQQFTYEHDVHLPPGRHTVEIGVQLPGQAEVRSLPLDVLVGPAGKPRLYVLAFGVDSNLEYTRQDAESIVSIFKTQQGKLYETVETELIIDKQTTAGDMAIELESFGGRSVREQDVIIVFFSGHGDIIEGEFRLMGRGFRRNAWRSSSLSYRQQIIAELNRLKGKKLILLDACRSGGIAGGDLGVKGPTQTLADAQRILAETPSGTAVITSSSGQESSYEDAVWQHGAFTHALVEALQQGRADRDRNGSITVRELHQYVKNRVGNLVRTQKKKDQTPLLQIDNEDFPIYWTK